MAGIAKEFNGRASYESTVLDALQKALEKKFAIDVVHTNAKNGSLPQSRTKIWIAGQRRDKLPSLGLPGPLPPASLGLPGGRLLDILNPHLPCTRRSTLCPGKRKNLENFKFQIMVKKKLNQISAGQIAICSIDRSEGAIWKPRIQIDESPTITTTNTWLWVLSVDDCGQADEKDRKFSRYLAHEERFLLQSHNATMYKAFGDAGLAAKACGNAYPPVFVAAVWAPMICSCPAGTFDDVTKPDSFFPPSTSTKQFKLPK